MCTLISFWMFSKEQAIQDFQARRWHYLVKQNRTKTFQKQSCKRNSKKEEVDVHLGEENYFDEINSSNAQKAELSGNVNLKTIISLYWVTVRNQPEWFYGWKHSDPCRISWRNLCIQQKIFSVLGDRHLCSLWHYLLSILNQVLLMLTSRYLLPAVIPLFWIQSPFS